MRYVVVGLGAIGGAMAARLAATGASVVGVARGAHLSAIRSSGILVRSPAGDLRVPLDVVADLGAAAPGPEDVVVVATKSQDTAAVLQALPSNDIPVICAQNGVSNEPEALRYTEHVLGMTVMSASVHLEPGVVIQYGTPVHGMLDLGRFPRGIDDLTERVAADLTTAGYRCDPTADIARWKYAKLVVNLGNAVEVVCGPANRQGALTSLLEAEAERILQASGIDSASAAERRARYGGVVRQESVDGQARPGGSTWQSAQRGQRTEVDYLSGEIVRLARMAGAPAPANALLQKLTHQVSAGRLEVGGTTEQQVLAMLEAG